MMKKGKKQDGRSTDFTFGWMLTTLGSEWRQWQKYAAEWMAKQEVSTSIKQIALTRFFECYLFEHAPYAIDVIDFFKGYKGHRCTIEEFMQYQEGTGIQNKQTIAVYSNYIVDFVNYIVEHHFSEEDDSGQLMSLVHNPLMRVKKKGNLTETVRNPLPYRYIQTLRNILCPLPNKTEITLIKQDLKAGGYLLPSYHYRHFKHWIWAQKQTANANSGGDWFEVEPEDIDKNDPDCVWRIKKVTRNINDKEKHRTTIHQIWSPVKAMVIFMKLHLPLRTYQVRMLDNGEADTWRYEGGKWKVNKKYAFALGSERRPFSKGVFRRIHDTMTSAHSIGFYINTNKTADQNKNELERGYIIPWQHKEVFYWLEKLRNWQEKYNPINNPTDCTSLLKKHTGIKKPKSQLKSMGDICFLFRNASAKGEDKVKPIPSEPLAIFWYQLLHALENQLSEEGNTLDNGEKIKLVVDYPEGKIEGKKSATLFPLHSLRVSLITAYTMDTQLPLPVISKLLAGHT